MSEKYDQFNIERLTLSDFRCFKEFSIAFNLEPRVLFSQGKSENAGPLTVLVAKNGKGKTSILDAIRILFGTYARVFSKTTNTTNKGVKSSVHATSLDIRNYRDENGQLKQSDTMTVDGEVWLGGTQEFACRSLNRKPDARTTHSEVSCISEYGRSLIDMRKNNGATDWPLLAFYGTGRLWSATKRTERTLLLMDDPVFGYENSLGKDHNFQTVRDWLTNAVSKRSIDSADDLRPNPIMESQLRAVSKSLSSVLSEEGYLPELTIESLTNELAIKQKTPDGIIPVPVSQLSDGVRAAFGLVSDIAFRCAKLNPHLGEVAPAKTHGIVLVDEVDLHLHPAWQQKILKTLQLAFPKLQFIVTTHSPQVISSVPRECVRIIDPSASESLSLVSQTQGVESQDILAEVFGTSGAPETDEWVIKLNEYATRVATGHVPKDDPALQDLVGHYGSGYQPLLRIELQRRILERKAAQNA